jgi:1-phosphofructokinase family hexose kinase
VITIIGPNLAVDHILDVPGFAAGRVWRSRYALHLAGGKPMNVARTLRRLGVEVRLISPLGGKRGEPQLMADACCELGVHLVSLPIASSIRTCVIVADSAQGAATVINELGPELSSEEAAAYERLMVDSLQGGELILASGSLPPGLPPNLYQRLVVLSSQRGARVIIDASGEVLQYAIMARPWAVKVNGEELMAVDNTLSEKGDCTGTQSESYSPYYRYVHAATALLARGVEHVVVTLGDNGALYIGQVGKLHISALPVRVVNPTGSGDVFLAGLAAELQRTDSWPDALRLASVVAGLAASHLEPDIGPNPDLKPLLAQVEMRTL